MKKKPNLERLSETFGRAHRNLAKWEQKKKEARAKLIQAVDQTFDESELARQTIYLSNLTDDEITDYVSVHYPKWEILSVLTDDTQTENKILLQEKPEYKKAVIFNNRDGMIYQRTVTESAPDFDEELMKTEDPDLYKRVTKEITYRDWKPLNDISEVDRQKMLKFLQPPKLSVRLEQPRKPKPEEEEGFDNE